MIYTQINYYTHLLLISKHKIFITLVIYLIFYTTLKNTHLAYCMTENEPTRFSDISLEEEDSDTRLSNVSFLRLSDLSIIEETPNNMFSAEAKRPVNNEYITQEKGIWIGAEGKVEITKTDTGFRVEIKRNISNDIVAEKKDI